MRTSPPRLLWLVAAVSLGLGSAALPARAAILTLQNGLNGYNGTEDTYLEKGNGADDFNWGESERLVVFNRSSRDTNPLLRFDFSSLPEITAVNGATLYLTTAFLGRGEIPGVRPPTSGPGRINLYPITQDDQDWVGGAGNGAVVAGTSTFNDKRNPSVDWSNGVTDDRTGNVDLGSEITNAAMANEGQEAVFDLDSATALLFDWIQNPGNNAGFLFASDLQEEFFPNNGWHSSEAPIQSFRPRLVLDVELAQTPVPEPTTLLLVAPLIALLLWRRRRGK